MVLSKNRIVLFIVFVCWSLAVAAGFLWLSIYSANAGQPSTPPASINTQFNPTGKPQLLVFLHPNCSCSMATLNELQRVLASVRNKPDVHIVFADVGIVEQSPLWQQAQSLAAASIQVDSEQLAQQLSVHTSGDMLLYSAQGYLLFNGGITASRGHEGDNAGKSQLVATLNNEHLSTTASTPVYGCRLAQQHTDKPFSS